MKTQSLKDPFPRLEDKLFDRNHDGKLDALETAFRDAYISDMENRRAENRKKRPVQEERPAVLKKGRQ